MWMGMDLEKHVEPGMEAIRPFENSRRTFLNSLVYNNWSTRCQSPSWPIQCGSRNSLVIWVFVPTAQAENELHSKDLQSSVAGLISMSEQNTSDSSEPEIRVCLSAGHIHCTTNSTEVQCKFLNFRSHLFRPSVTRSLVKGSKDSQGGFSEIPVRDVGGLEFLESKLFLKIIMNQNWNFHREGVKPKVPPLKGY